MTTTEGTNASKTQAFVVRFDRVMHERLRQSCFALRITKSSLVRRAVTEFLDRQDADPVRSHKGETCTHCGRIPASAIVVSLPGEPRQIACVPLCQQYRDRDGYPVTLGCTVELQYEGSTALGKVRALATNAIGQPVAEVEIAGAPTPLFLQTTALMSVRR